MKLFETRKKLARDSEKNISVNYFLRNVVVIHDNMNGVTVNLEILY